MTTYRITEKARLHKSQIKPSTPYTVEANGYTIENGLVTFYTFYMRVHTLTLATSVVERIEIVEGTDQP